MLACICAGTIEITIFTATSIFVPLLTTLVYNRTQYKKFCQEENLCKHSHVKTSKKMLVKEQ